MTSDPVDGDPKAIPDTRYEAAGWSPLPSSGPDYVAGGFDAPRAANTPSAAFWQLWLDFRETMVSNYQWDFATWVTTAADTLQQDRVQFHPLEALPLDGDARRTRMRKAFEAGLQNEAREPASPPIAAYIQPIDARAPLYYRPWAIIAPLLQGRSLFERLSLYRPFFSFSGLALFCAGVTLLHRAAAESGAVLAHGLVWLVAYVVFTVASATNYGPAIGLGSFLAACMLALVVSERESLKRVAAGLFAVGG